MDLPFRFFLVFCLVVCLFPEPPSMKPFFCSIFGLPTLSLSLLVPGLLVTLGVSVYGQPLQLNTPQSQWDDLAAQKSDRQGQPQRTGFDVNPTGQASWWK